MMGGLSDSRRRALHSASHWYVLLADEPVSPRQAAKWQQWYEQDLDNQWAWQQVESLRSQLGGVPGNIASRVLNDSQLTRRRVLKGLLLLLGAGGGWQLWDSDTGEGLRADYRTAKGDIRQYPLADGTLLSLNTDSAVDVRFDEQQRLVRLWYGEIAITTGHDSRNRPFRVQTRQAQLTALGTEFTVRQEPGTTRLAVLQHAVEVRLAGDDAIVRVIPQGNSLFFSATAFGTQQPVNREESSWRQGVLTFSDKPLGEVISILARYRRGILRCDPAVAGLRLSGTFPARDSDALLHILEQTLPVNIHYVTRYWVTVEPRQQQ